MRRAPWWVVVWVVNGGGDERLVLAFGSEEVGEEGEDEDEDEADDQACARERGGG